MLLTAVGAVDSIPATSTSVFLQIRFLSWKSLEGWRLRECSTTSRQQLSVWGCESSCRGCSVCTCTSCNGSVCCFASESLSSTNTFPADLLTV